MTGMIFVLLTILGTIIPTQGRINETVGGTVLSPTDNVDLQCRSDQPKPRNIQWFKDGKLLTSIPGQYDLRKDTESLEVINVGEGEGGEYVCIDKDNGDTAKVLVEVGAWAENNPDVVKNQGESFTIDCHAWGVPNPTIKWYKDGKELPIDGNHYKLERKPTVQNNVTLKDGRLVISGSTASDTGKYKCEATNIYGPHTGSTSVRIKEPFPLSLLWPILGILALLILLGVGIGLFLFFRHRYKKNEKKRKAKWKKLEAERQKQGQAVRT